MSEQEQIKYPMSMLISNVKRRIWQEEKVKHEENLHLFIKKMFRVERKLKAMQRILYKIKDKNMDEIYWDDINNLLKKEV